jgi:hypothetical protein
VLVRYRELGEVERVAKALGSIGKLLRKAYRPVEAVECFEEQLEIVRAKEGTRSVAEATVLFELGGALADQTSRSSLQRAIEVMTEARDIMKAELPSSDPRVEHIDDDIAALQTTLGAKGARW